MSTIGDEKRRALARLFSCVSRTSVNEDHFSEPMKVSFIERKILRCVKGLSGSLYMYSVPLAPMTAFSDDILEKAFLYNNRPLRAFKFAFLLQLVGVERRTKEGVKNF